VTHQLVAHGLLLLFAFVAIESAGVPLPGETALIAASILVTQGHYTLWEVIVVASIGAIFGDNVGYWIGRIGGRGLLERWEPLARYSRRALPPAERFFAKHGSKTVFLGRFIAFLRVTAAWLAGISHMPWKRFLIWNAAGGIAWATLVAVISYEFGRAAGDAIGKYGLYGVIVVVVLGLAAFLGIRLWRRRLEHPR
jgi:membrane protein DedA with SNARE-associated domain